MSGRVEIEFTITETTNYTGRMSVDAALFEQVTGVQFDLERIADDDIGDLLQRYERAAMDRRIDEDEHTEHYGNVTGQDWSDVEVIA